MDVLLNQRRAIKGQITRLETIIAGHGTQPLTNAALEIYWTKANQLTSKLESVEQDIAITCHPTDFPLLEEEYNKLMERLEMITITLTTAISQIKLPTQPNRSSHDIRLPKLELPTFGGNYIDWLSFHDLYVATVHNNSQLSDARKFQYLKSSVLDEAALLIKSIPITDANYPEAWDILLNRYNNTREIINAQIKRLFNQNRVTHESASELRKLIDTTSEGIRALKVLGEPVAQWNSILVYTVTENLDPESRRQWELSLTGTTAPSFDDLRVFLEQRARAIAAAQATNTRVKLHSTKRRTTMSHLGITSENCVICKEEHSIYRCTSFAKTPIQERWELVKKKELCFNCLRRDHSRTDCKSGHCRKCTHMHNTMLHSNSRTESNMAAASFEPEVHSHISREPKRKSQVLFSTAMIVVKDGSGKFHQARALLDSASEASFITERCANSLQLKQSKLNITIGGIGACGMGSSRGIVELEVSSSLDRQSKLQFEALVLKTITKQIPSMEVDPSTWGHIKGLHLADPKFHTPQEIDILLGADVYVDILQNGHCKGSKDTPRAFNTIFGWVISGQLTTSLQLPEIHVHHCKMEDQISKFWEIEDMPEKKLLTPNEIACEKHFADTHTRLDNGRYMVRLPFKDSSKTLGDSKKIALRRFVHVKRRLQKTPKNYEEYKKFMDEYLLLGHMELIDPTDTRSSSDITYYAPHLDVHNEKGSSTKTRVVFDALAKSANGVSLNDILLVGPKLQDDLVNILICFRLYAVAMIADIAKMYRQILVHPEDTDFQRIVWRSSVTEPIQEYRLLTVTYATVSAPYRTTKVLQQLALEIKEAFPMASEKLDKDFSMDDLLSGANSVQEAFKLQDELLKATATAGLDIRKWVSNEPALLQAVPLSKQEIQVPLLFESEASVTTLGLHWTPATDNFSYVITSPPYRPTVTKRTILSDTAKIFDPLGLLSPVTIRAKLLIQDSWKLMQDWDEALPESLVSRLQDFRTDLPAIENIRISRYVSKRSYDSKFTRIL